MRRSEQDASYTRRVIMQLHRPVKLKLRRTIFLNFLRPLVLSDRRDFFVPGPSGSGPPPDRKFLNSWFQTGLKNLIDLAVIAKQEELGAAQVVDGCRRETWFDELDPAPVHHLVVGRRGHHDRPAEVIRDADPLRLLRRPQVLGWEVPGAANLEQGPRHRRVERALRLDDLVERPQPVAVVEEMLDCCAWAEREGRAVPLTEEVRRQVLVQADRLNAQGMRVIAVAQKSNPAPVGQFSAADECDMVLIGFLAFLDPPKQTAPAAIEALHSYGVRVKVLTGDNEKVTRAICAQVGLPAEHILLGSDIDAMTDPELAARAGEVSVFAKLSPAQKARIVRLLRQDGHCVGYMGDGINDAAALRAADVSISVDTAVDVAKESASIVLLDKDLMVLEQGLIEGRKTYANMMKYIKMTVSSNFGNMLSVLAASAFLPFLPMTALQLILLNLVYDLSCTAISWDKVDAEYLRAPCRWDAGGILRFMLWNGPVSSVFDIAVFLLMYFVFCPASAGGRLYTQLTDPAAREAWAALFQTGWFVASMWTQTLVIHMVRTARVPLLQSRASAPLTGLTLAGIAAVTVLPFTPLAEGLGLAALPAGYFAALAGIVAGYILLESLAKELYIKKYHSWL